MFDLQRRAEHKYRNLSEHRVITYIYWVFDKIERAVGMSNALLRNVEVNAFGEEFRDNAEIVDIAYRCRSLFAITTIYYEVVRR
jgi:hypothetical protein